MADIAELGFAIDSSPAVTAADNLDKLSDSAARTTSATEKMQAQIEKSVQQVRKAAGGYDSMGAGARAYIAEANALRDAMQREAKSLDDVIEKRDWYIDALKKGMLTQKEYIEALKALDSQEAKIQRQAGKTAEAVGNTDGALAKLNLTSRLVVNNYVAMARALSAGDFEGFSRAAMSAVANSGALRVGLGLLATTAGAAGIALGAVGIAALKGASDQRSFENAIIASGNAAGVSAGQLLNMANAVGSSANQYGKAREALDLLVRSGKVTGDAMESAARATVALSEITGASIKQAATEIESLGADPVAAIVKLNDKYNFLTLAIYDQIKALQDQGDQEAATTLAMDAAANALDNRRAQIVENIGYIGQAYKEAKGFVLDLWEAMKQVGQDPTNASNMAKLYAQRGANEATIEQLYNPSIMRGTVGALRGEKARMDEAARLIAANKDIDDQLAKLREVGAQQAKNDAEAAGQNALEKNAIAARNSIEATIVALDKQAKKQTEIKKLDASFAALRAKDPADRMLTDGSYEKALAAINAKYKESETSSRAASKAVDELNRMFAKDAQELAKLRGALDPANKAYQTYVATISAAYAAMQKEIALAPKGAKGDADRARAVEIFNEKKRLSVGLMQQEIDKIHEQVTAVDSLLEKLREEGQQVGMTADEIALANTMRQAEIALKRDNIDVSSAEGQARLAEIRDLKASNIAHKNYVDQVRDATDRVRGYYESMADSLAAALTRGGNVLKNLGDAMVDTLRQIVTQMIAQWLRTNIIGTFMGGGGIGMLGAIGAAFSGGAGAADFTSTAAGGTANSLLSGASWIAAGKNLWNGWMAASAAPGSSIMGSWTGNGAIFGAGVDPSYAGGGVYNPSMFGYGLAAAGGLYAGYNRYQQGGLGGGLVGGAVYGYGAYSAAMAGGAAMTGGLGAAAGAIPVVGWVALAAMLIDKFSGGKLFGTDANKFVGGNQSINVGAGGANVATQATYKGQGALFSGAYWETHNVDTPQETIDAVQAFFAGLTNSVKTFADAFGVKAGDLIGGSLLQKFDKDGNVTSSLSTVLGKTWNDTIEQFQQRLQAENYLAVLGQFDSGISAAIDKYRASAETLLAVTQGLAVAQTAFNAGAEFLALGTDQSLTALLKLAEGAQQLGESIDQTLQRIIQAQAAYDQFVAQFKPPTLYVDDFQAALAGINDQMLANIKQANDLARAAGAEGAATKDLVNIHAVAARQFAELLKQLEASAQSSAFALGLTNIGSLDDINAEIQRLQAKAGDGASSVRDFGSAMQTAAQKASDAINLLLGDLSPLNDQRKLQVALQGLAQGTVSQEQVLQIGRRLYASSQAYNDLFARVQGMGGRAAADYSGGAGSSSGGLSASESSRLTELLAQQQQMQAAAQVQQYQTLAQQIAEIAMARGDDWRTVVDSMGIDLGRLEEGLGLTSDEAMQAYIENIQSQTDDNKQNTTSIVAALDRILAELQRGNGTNPDNPRMRTPTTPGTLPSAEEIGESVGRHVSREIAPFIVNTSQRRNDRGAYAAP